MKKTVFTAGGLLLVICFLTYYRLWHKPEEVRSNTFTLARVFSAHTSHVWAVSFSPDGTLLAGGSVDSTIKVWNKESGELVHNLKQPGGITYLAFSPDGHLLATSSYDATVRLWQLPEGTLRAEHKGHRGTVWSVSFSPDGKTIATCGEDATVRLWDAESGNLKKTLSGHTLNVWDVKFSPDGAKLASGSFDHTIKIWDANTGALLKTIDGHSEAVVSLAFSPDARVLASTSDDKTVKLWDMDDGTLLRALEAPEHVQASSFSPDGRWLLTGGRDQATLGEFLQNFLGDSEYNKGVSMRLWEVETGRLLQTFSNHANDVNDVAFSPDGKWIASGSSDFSVQLWRLTE